MTTIYAVTEGNYSDYHVVALFSTRERAEELTRTLTRLNEGECARVEEFYLDTWHDTGMVPFLVWSSFGSVEVASVMALVTTDQTKNLVTRQASGVLNCCVWARDEQHAIKIAADLFRHFVAQDEAK